MYLDSAGNVIKNASTKGHLAVGVPGSVAGLEYAREKYGTRARGTLIAPAIGFAERGFVLDEGDIALFATATDDFRDDPATAAIFLNKGQPYKAGRSTRAEGPGEHAAPDRAARPRRLLSTARRRRDRRVERGRQRHHHQRGSRAIQGARACAGRMRLPRLSHRVGAAAQLRRRGGVRDPQYSRGLIRSRTSASVPRRQCITRSKRCGMRMSIATAIWAIPTS